MAVSPLRLRPTGKTLEGTLAVPGDKSIAHRAAFFAGLAGGTSVVSGFPTGADNAATVAMMEALGARVQRAELPGGALELTVAGFAGRPRPAADPVELDCGNSGTTTRIGMGVVAGLPVTAVFAGDASLSRRPMGRVTRHLIAMGAGVEPEGHDDPDRLPLRLTGGALHPYEVATDKASAQVKSAILMAGLTAGVPVRVTEPHPSRDHTERFLEFLYPGAGVVERQDTTVALRPPAGALPAFAMTVPGDPSSGAFWAALAAVAGGGPDGGRVLLERLNWNPTRTGFFAALQRMGVAVSSTPSAAASSEPMHDVRVAGRPRRGVEIGGADVVAAIDELPLLALMGLFLPAGEAVTLRDAGELRVKESDRIDATAAVVEALGGTVEAWSDGMRVGPPPGGPTAFRGGAVVDARHDHRIAMGAAVAAIGAGADVAIAGAEVARVSYPGFWDAVVEFGLAEVGGGGGPDEGVGETP